MLFSSPTEGWFDLSVFYAPLPESPFYCRLFTSYPGPFPSAPLCTLVSVGWVGPSQYSTTLLSYHSVFGCQCIYNLFAPHIVRTQCDPLCGDTLLLMHISLGVNMHHKGHHCTRRGLWFTCEAHLPCRTRPTYIPLRVLTDFSSPRTQGQPKQKGIALRSPGNWLHIGVAYYY